MKSILLLFTNLFFLPILFGSGLQAQSKFFSFMQGNSLLKDVETAKNIKDFNVLRQHEVGLRNYFVALFL